MKIRTDFVANSSSSSFVIVGNEINSLEKLKESKNPHMIGIQLCDGIDYFNVSNYIDYISQKMFENYIFIDEIDSNEYRIDLNTSKITTDKISIFSENIDYHCTEDIEHFIEHYKNYIDFNKIKAQELIK